MSMCHAEVSRTAARDAVVTVSWPDGGKRSIIFRNGRIQGSDSSQSFTFAREEELNIIRIGKSERFEITDDLAFGG